MYLISMLIVIIANIGYILFQDFIPSSIDPIVSLCCMYGSGMIVAAMFFLLTKEHKTHKQRKQANKKYSMWSWRVLAFSAVNIMIDAGFLLAFRYGWEVSIMTVISNVFILIGLTVIGIIFFKEKLSLTNFIGLLCGIVGISILSF